jgi:hypothetical protein
MVKLVPAGGRALSGDGTAGSGGRVVLVLDCELVEIVSTVAIDVSADFSVLTVQPSDMHNATI